MARPKGIIAGSARCRFNPCFLRKLISRYLRRSQHHHHLAAFHLWHGLNPGGFFHFLTHTLEHLRTKFLVRHLTAAETQSDLHLVTSLDELADILHFDLIVVFINVRTELDFLNVDNLLLLAGFVGAFLGLILEFTEIQDLANRRVNIRLYFNEVETDLISTLNGFINRDDAELFAIFINTTDTGCGYGAVNTGA